MIRLRNFTSSPVYGWFRTTTDADIEPALRAGGCDIVRGRRIGESTHAVDVLASIEPGQTLEIDLDRAVRSDTWAASVRPPADIVGHFGGVPALNGVPLALVSIGPDGAGFRGHYRGRVGRMFAVDVFLGPWYAEHSAVVPAEVLVTCSNPEVPDMGDTLPALALTFGDGHLVGGLPRAGMRFADGQSRAVPVCFVWPRHLRTAADWSYAAAIATKAIGAVGVSSLLPHGNPRLPATFDLPAWAAQHWIRCMSQLTTWEHPQLGPAADTGQTGAVEDQCFVGGECMGPGGVGAELVNYYAALLTSGHPMHHLEHDGTVVDRDRRPGLRMFYSRPHSSGTDRLGKPRDLSVAEANGWNGPDAQHWTINRLAVAGLTTDSPAVQRLLEHHARNYLIQITTDPQFSTSAIWSSRELGWEGIAAVHLWRCLEDRALAERVRVHWRERVTRILVPQLASKDIWDVRRDDARLGSGDWWMPWQQALGVYGIDLACEILGPAEGRPIALAGARRILADAWERVGDRWVEHELLALDGRRQRSGMFTSSWLPLAVAVVLRHEPGNERARAVWQQIVADADGNGRWLPPESPAG